MTEAKARFEMEKDSKVASTSATADVADVATNRKRARANTSSPAGRRKKRHSRGKRHMDECMVDSGSKMTRSSSFILPYLAKSS